MKLIYVSEYFHAEQTETVEFSRKQNNENR